MQGLRGYLIKVDKSCSHVETLASLESATAPDTKLLWLDIQGEFSPEAEAELSRMLVIAKAYLVTYHRFPVRSIEETLEEEALYRPGTDLLERIVPLRDEILDLGGAMAPQQTILAQMASGVCQHVRPFIQPYFKDAESRLRNLIDEQNSYKETLANALELYRSAMSSRTNDAMKVLTAMSTLFLPLTFLTGLFGMNVTLPLVHQHHAFTVIVALCASSFAGMMIYFKTKAWF